MQEPATNQGSELRPPALPYRMAIALYMYPVSRSSPCFSAAGLVTLNCDGRNDMRKGWDFK